MAIKRVDGNHRQIVQALHQVGAVVIDVHALPGALDLLVAYRGILMLLEIKDGTKPKSAQKLTPMEVATIEAIRAVGGRVEVVTSVDDALRAIGAIK